MGRLAGRIARRQLDHPRNHRLVLFATRVWALRVEVQVEIKNTDREIFNDFRPFIAMLTGIREPGACVSLTAALYGWG
ncbi:MAG: hypothetical protein ACXW3K_10370 [Brevundimonas sp.]